MIGLDVAAAELRDHFQVIGADVGQRESGVGEFGHAEDIAHQAGRVKPMEPAPIIAILIGIGHL